MCSVMRDAMHRRQGAVGLATRPIMSTTASRRRRASRLFPYWRRRDSCSCVLRSLTTFRRTALTSQQQVLPHLPLTTLVITWSKLPMDHPATSQLAQLTVVYCEVSVLAHGASKTDKDCQPNEGVSSSAYTGTNGLKLKVC